MLSCFIFPLKTEIQYRAVPIPSENNLNARVAATYIAASYVKWIEAAGGRVVPLIAGSDQNFTQVYSTLSLFQIPVL
jgi:hypothetical protein